ncbi:MAG: alkaline phosphatase D family protein [Campylobacterales bacterium]|nr:alkaline phosphatase D family protein [Campylobacterales bacterium]
MTRREFIKISGAVASTILISSGLTACGGSSNDSENLLNVAFNHGVASGDPLATSVIIWTRITHLDAIESDIQVDFEVATDEAFTHLTNNGTYVAKKESDFTVKVDVQNLQAGTTYYYRFSSNGKTSPTGRAKTLPTSNPEQVKMALFTCANYTNGYFNVYTEAAKMGDLDVTLHLGDYIYEYGMYENDDFDAKVPAYATSKALEIGRALPSDNNKELLSLDDYRKRYALYHTDSGTQAIHAAAPMIVVWDDHEVANDTHQEGAQNHDESEGSFTQRTHDALQAYFEWLPIRTIDDKKAIYRSFHFGNLVSLYMLETRLFGRDKQLSYSSYFDAQGNFDAVTFQSDVANPTRTMLGATQLEWLQGQMATSNASWQVLGQQVLMGKMNLPYELLTLIAQLGSVSGETKTALLTQLNTLMMELVTIKTRMLQQDPTLTQEEMARVMTVLPYNLDAWDGYFVERETIYGTAKALGKKLVVVAGDTHNAWANNLKDMNGEAIGVEFATPSVTSPGLEEYVGLSDTATAAQFEGAIKLLVDDLKYLNAYDRGFMTLTFKATQVTADWYYVNNYDSTEYSLNTLRYHTLTVANGEGALSI